MERALIVTIDFPGRVYRGADFGRPEALPSPARVHSAFVSAASGGPDARSEGSVLVAAERDRDAVGWLERHRPLGVFVPDVQPGAYSVVRHRVRAAVDPNGAHDLHRDETDFEPFAAVSGPVSYAWPAAPPEVAQRLAELAREITHVGRADSAAIVTVADGTLDPSGGNLLRAAEGRGPGRALRVPISGRWEALVSAYIHASTPARNRHAPGTKGKQAKDELPATAGDTSTELVRFAKQRVAASGWPFLETWMVPMSPLPPSWAMRPRGAVRSAVLVHRALVAAIGDDVPSFITGRDGGGPLAGPGHLAIQYAPLALGQPPALVLGVPPGVPESDRAALLEALSSQTLVGFRGTRVRLGAPRLGSAQTFWSHPAPVMATSVPLVLDAPGTPRDTPWSLDDAVLCSIGYALRGMLESDGLEWGSGWTFRRALVNHLRASGVEARGFRVPGSASPFLHRSREGDLLVAAHATVRLGEMGGDGRRFLALGRARHLGGGLLMPLMAAA